MKVVRLKESDLQRIVKRVLNEITSDDITQGVGLKMHRSKFSNEPEDFLDHGFETIGQAKDKEWDKEDIERQKISDDIYNTLKPALNNVWNTFVDKYGEETPYWSELFHDELKSLVDTWYDEYDED